MSVVVELREHVVPDFHVAVAVTYPELREKHDYILQILSLEEKRFDATIDAGLSILSNLARDVLASGKTVISGDDAFRLYDTFGFPKPA